MTSSDSASERLRLAFDLFEFAEGVTLARLRRAHPDQDAAGIERLFREWLATRPGAESGDGVGTPSTRFDR